MRHHGALTGTVLTAGGGNRLVQQGQGILCTGQGFKLLPGESGAVGCRSGYGSRGVFGRVDALGHAHTPLESLRGRGLLRNRSGRFSQGVRLRKFLFQNLQQVALQHILG